MKGLHLRLYTYENRKHHGQFIHDWLLSTAKKMGIHGGSAFKAMAGFGRHGTRHEQHFFELAGEEPVLVEFMVGQAQARDLLALLHAEGLPLFYALLPAEYGVVGHDAAESLA